MKKDFVWDAVLLPLGYFLFAFVIFIGFIPRTQQEYPTSASLRATFNQHFETFDQISRTLWEHPDYFDALYEKDETHGLLFNKKNALEKYSSGGCLTTDEWNQLKDLCEIIQPNEITMRSYDGANAIQWLFTVKEKRKDPYTLALYYIRVPDASSPEEERAVSEKALSYFGRYGSLSPIEGKDFWYEAAIVPNTVRTK